MPIVCYYDKESDTYELVDGYHRFTIIKTSKRINDREKGMLPVSVIDRPQNDRIASTIRHNRARGTHDISLMTKIVADLIDSGMSDSWIISKLGMDVEELLRLKQITGLAALFKDKDFSKS
jgi:ParB-like chromosome segregation protein Spo0J